MKIVWLDLWVDDSSTSPVFIDAQKSDFSDKWISLNQSNPQLLIFNIGGSTAGSIANGVGSKLFSGVATSAAEAVANGKSGIILSVATANAGSASVGAGTKISSSIAVSVANSTTSVVGVSERNYSLGYWISDTNLSPAFVGSKTDYFDHWISENQDSPQTARFTVTISSIGTAVADSTAEGEGSSVSVSIGTAVADSIAEGEGSGVIPSIGTIVADSSTEGEGSSVGESTGTAIADSSTEGEGSSVGESTGTAVADSAAEGKGSSVGVSIGTAVADSIAEGEGSGVVPSIGTIVANSIAASIGNSAVLSIGTAVANSIAASIGSSSVLSIGTALADSSAEGAVDTGTATGVALADSSAEGASGEIVVKPDVFSSVSGFNSIKIKILPGPKPGKPAWENDWNLTGVYAIVPDRTYKFIEIKFDINGDTYSRSFYTDSRIKLEVTNSSIERIPQRPIIVTLEDIGFDEDRDEEPRMVLKNVKRKANKPKMELQWIT
jgi:hypothetical protein